MSNETGAAGVDGDADNGSDVGRHEAPPDESTLMGKAGVETEVLAELARAEAKLADTSASDDPDAAGAQV